MFLSDHGLIGRPYNDIANRWRSRPHIYANMFPEALPPLLPSPHQGYQSEPFPHPYNVVDDESESPQLYTPPPNYTK